MTTATKTLGRRGEKTAQLFLMSRGLTPLDTNWRAGRKGEIDLVMEDAGEIVFVEVKTRSGPEESIFELVDHKKLWRLRNLAATWLAQTPHNYPYRIDVVAIKAARGSTKASLHWWKGVDR